MTRTLIERHGLAEFATVVHRPLKNVSIGGEVFVWYDIDGLAFGEKVEMILVDGPPFTVHPLARYPALPLMLPHLAPGAVVILDDAKRPEEVRIAERWRSEYPGFEFGNVDVEKGALVVTRRETPRT